MALSSSEIDHDFPLTVLMLSTSGVLVHVWAQCGMRYPEAFLEEISALFFLHVQKH